MAMPFDKISGNALGYDREETLPGVGFRGVNEAFSEDVGIINPMTEVLKIMGGDMDVDRYIVVMKRIAVCDSTTDGYVVRGAGFRVDLDRGGPDILERVVPNIKGHSPGRSIS